jgi:hypothetical protein
MQQLQKLNRIIFLIPEVVSNVDEDFIKSRNLDEKGIKNQSLKQSRAFVQWLSKFFNHNWRYLTHEGHPFLHKLSYGHEKEDLRYLCVFRTNEIFTSVITGMNSVRTVYLKRLFQLGWEEAAKLNFTSAPGGTHNTKCEYMLTLIPYLNLKFDKSDVIIDIGYGTGRLLFALSAMLGTKVYGTDIEDKVFSHTISICEPLAKNLANK